MRTYRWLKAISLDGRGLLTASHDSIVRLWVCESAARARSGIPITERLTDEERTCGVCVIYLRSGQLVALLRFETAVQEVFAVTVLPDRRFPELINDDETLLENSFVVPDAALADRAGVAAGHGRTDPGAAGSAGNGSVPRGRL